MKCVPIKMEIIEIIYIQMRISAISNMNLRPIIANTNYVHIANRFIFAKLYKIDEQPTIARHVNNKHKERDNWSINNCQKKED